jgi:pyruvate/2-oxoglutarate dehydrogenase complex dihydrolipoamide dehydrogenase (E3) component
VVEEIATHHPAEVFEKRGIKVIFGSPKFIDQKSLEVDSQKITAKKFIICSGSHPVIPPIEGLKNIDYLTNENIFALEKLPESIIVLGGGPIGVELAQALNRLGVKVYIVEMAERLLFREDKEIAAVLEKTVRKEGIQVLASARAVKFSKDNDKAYVTIEAQNKKQDTICAAGVLVAVGRAPNIAGLDLEKAGVEYSKTGIKVNEFLQTTNKNIFACGDVVGPYMFSHVASYQAQICVRNALFKRIAWGKVNYQNIAWATFSEPEVAHLGLTEEEARAKYKNIRVYKTEYSASDRAVTDLEKEGLIKAITDKKGFILGAHIAGAQASEIIQGFLLAKSFKIPLFKLSQVLFIYPTLSELAKKIAAKPLLEKANNPLIKFALSMMKNSRYSL